jgi:hypothetical protein
VVEHHLNGASTDGITQPVDVAAYVGPHLDVPAERGHSSTDLDE